MSDSKGAAIAKILDKNGAKIIEFVRRIAADPLQMDVNEVIDFGKTANQEAKQAILALLAQEVNKARKDEIDKILDRWGGSTLKEDLAYLENRLTQLERLG